MLFDFHAFIQELRGNDEKKEMVQQYEECYPNDLQKSLKEQAWYVGYVSKFKPVSYAVPKDDEENFDWNLLLQLVAGSFSSTLKFVAKEGSLLPDLTISVENDGKSIAKTVSELWGFQVLRLYEIYVEEMMTFQLYHRTDDKERIGIEEQRAYNLKKWNYKVAVEYETERELGGLLAA